MHVIVSSSLNSFTSERRFNIDTSISELKVYNNIIGIITYDIMIGAFNSCICFVLCLALYYIAVCF